MVWAVEGGDVVIVVDDAGGSHLWGGVRWMKEAVVGWGHGGKGRLVR